MNDIDPEFLSFLQEEETRAFDSVLLQEVETALKSYNGELYGNEEEGRSQVVARDVSETTDYMLTSVLEAFVASGRVVEFEPKDEADEQGADDATEALHYIYRRKSGYRTIHDWVKAGLLEKIAVVKSCVERKQKRVEGLYHPLMLPDNPIEQEQTQQPHPEDGAPMIRAVSMEETAAEFPDYFVPLEEFRVAPDARDLDSAVYLCHLTQKCISELVEMGFDRDTLDTVQSDNPLTTGLDLARNDGRTILDQTLDRRGALRQVWLREEYVLYDLNDDGIAERLCVSRIGNTILTRDGEPAVEEVDYQPFEYWCPFPMQGRLIGQSLADKTVDIQLVNTVLERNALDSLYMSVAPGTMINEASVGDNTISDLLTVRPRRIVRWKGSIPPIPEQIQDISQIAFQAIEFKTRQRESRTGITRLNKGVDEDTINETARGQAQLMSRGQQMERYVIRNFAEGVARLFMKKVGMMRREGKPFQIRVDGQYRQVDPSQWPEDMEVNVRVGLGSGSKDERIAYRNTIGQVQSLLKEVGSPLVTDDNVYNNAVGMCRDMGFAPNDFFTEPPKDQNGNPIPPQQQPDPKAQALMAELQMKQQQMAQAQQEGQQKLQVMAQKNASDAQIAQAKMELESQIAVRQQNLQTWLQQQELALQAAKHVHDMGMKADESKARIAKLRQGGSLAK